MKYSKVNSSNILFVMIQGICTLITIVAIIMYFFRSEMIYLIPFCVGMTLFSLSWNNDKIYHRKFFTVLYFLFGVLSILYGMISWRL